MTRVIAIHPECEGCINNEYDPFRCEECINGSNWEGEEISEELTYQEFKDLIFHHED